MAIAESKALNFDLALEKLKVNSAEHAAISGFKVNASAGNLTSVVLGDFLQRDVLDSHAYARTNPEAMQRFNDFWTTGLEQATSRGFKWVVYGPAANDSAFDIRTTARIAA